MTTHQSIEVFTEFELTLRATVYVD